MIFYSSNIPSTIPSSIANRSAKLRIRITILTHYPGNPTSNSTRECTRPTPKTLARLLPEKPAYKRERETANEQAKTRNGHTADRDRNFHFKEFICKLNNCSFNRFSPSPSSKKKTRNNVPSRQTAVVQHTDGRQKKNTTPTYTGWKGEGRGLWKIARLKWRSSLPERICSARAGGQRKKRGDGGATPFPLSLSPTPARLSAALGAKIAAGASGEIYDLFAAAITRVRNRRGESEGWEVKKV